MKPCKKRIVRMLAVLCLLSGGVAVAVEPVDINNADAPALAKALVGIGESKAALIVEYRDEHGGYASADELVNVKGIGVRLVDANRDKILVGQPQ